MTDTVIKQLLAGVLAAFVSLSASAMPIRATFSGAVSGSNTFTDVLNDFSIGTAASFDITFDDSGLVPTAPIVDLDLAPVSGMVRLGADEWLIDAGRITSYSYQFADGQINWYGMHLTGTGPTVAGGSGSLFGLFLFLTPQLTELANIPFAVGFRYPFAGGEYYSYANITGEFSASAVTTVAEPSTIALFMLPVLAVLWRARRSRRRQAAL
jgi:hypothetical protein